MAIIFVAVGSNIYLILLPTQKEQLLLFLKNDSRPLPRINAPDHSLCVHSYWQLVLFVNLSTSRMKFHMSSSGYLENKEKSVYVSIVGPFGSITIKLDR